MKIDLVSLQAKRRPSDLFLVGCFDQEKRHPILSSLEPEFLKSFDAAFKAKRFTGKKGEGLSSFNSQYHEAPEVVMIGLGSKDRLTRRDLGEAVGKSIQAASARRVKKIRILFDSFLGGKVSSENASETITETALLASYTFDKYQSKRKEKEDGPPVRLDQMEILYSKPGEAKKLSQGVAFGRIVAQGTLAARNLVNEPGNVIHPQKLVEEAHRIAREKKLKMTHLGLADLKRLKMGGILAVNRGSKTPPALIILEYGASHARRGTICLVGKGVTFDTGGISIKPSQDMEKMKFDKAGACTVIAAMGMIADLKLPLHVVGLAPAVENMPSEDPQRPGDIIKMYSGKTVEVLNTDAEGRLILGDALAYAVKYKPKAILDFATLTGMCAYTFADKANGLMGNDRRLLDRVKRAGEETGERCWELPLWDEYREMLKGHHSDLLNIGGKYAGTITAGMFLKEFVPKNTPWAHLDIAGTAWCDSSRYDCPKGATGVGVRLIANLLRNWK